MGMILPERRRVARFNDDSMAAAAHRLRAARVVAGLGVAEIARAGPLAPSVRHVEDAEAGRVLPNDALQSVYRRHLGLTADFFDRGEVKDVPIAIEDALFATLKAQLDG